MKIDVNASVLKSSQIRVFFEIFSMELSGGGLADLAFHPFWKVSVNLA